MLERLYALPLNIVVGTLLIIEGLWVCIQYRGLQPLLSPTGCLPWPFPCEVDVGGWKALFKGTAANGMD